MLLCIAAVCLIVTVAAEAQRAPGSAADTGARSRDARMPSHDPVKSPLEEMNEGGVAGAGIEALSSVRVGSGFAFTTGADFAPGDMDHLYVIQKAGLVRSLNLNTSAVSTILNLTGLVTGGTSLNDERGLLGITFHPNYPTDPYVFFNYTGTSGSLTTFVRRYTVTDTASDPIVIDSGSGVPVIQISQPFSNHNGGWIDFGPNDGYLYIGMGDGGDGCDPGARAQDITSQLLGKLLRIDVDGDDFPADATRNYAIPTTNPFVGVTGDDEIWAYGLRNPWRNGFDRMTGDLFIGDVGQFVWEEINFQPASSTGGENYGWDCMEAFVCSNTTGCNGSAGCSCATVNDVLPIGAYSHSGAGNVNILGSGCTVIGGLVYRGSAIPSLQGTYFYADYCSNVIGSFSYNGSSISNLQNRTGELAVSGFSIGTIVSFAEDAAGEMYIIDQGTGANGEIYKIIPAVGACCFDDGSCTDGMREPDCIAASGEWQGKNTTCATADCPQPAGACCISTTNCVNTDEDSCNGFGGTFLGVGTVCGENTCATPTGACCLSDGSCIDGLTQTQCENAGATYQGDGSDCAGTVCGGEPTGACCLEDGSCADDVTASDCATQGGTYQGDASDCTGVNCPQQTGACCMPDGSCVDDTLAMDCDLGGGVYQGDNIDCASISCPQPCIADMVDSVTFQPPGDGVVDGADLGFLLVQWGPNPGSPADIVDNVTFQPPPDGTVDGADLAYLLSAWGPCP